jgi:dUTP pyrophosphatase
MLVYYTNPNNVLHRGSTGSAGVDIRSNESLILQPSWRAAIGTGMHIKLNDSTFALIKDRSSMANKGITVSAGVIDSDYTGEVKVMLKNNTDFTFKIAKGDRIAQLIVLPYIEPVFHHVGSLDELGTTERGSGGFGSTGVN